jgi:rhamnogalacturonan endolyase
MRKARNNRPGRRLWFETLESRALMSAAQPVSINELSLAGADSGQATGGSSDDSDMDAGDALKRQMEFLDRGLVAVRRSATEAYIGWRLLGTDADSIAFNLYRSAGDSAPVKLNDMPLTQTTDFVDSTANLTVANEYFVRPIVAGIELAPSESFTLAANSAVQQYLNIPLQAPPGGVTPDGQSYSYNANDASVGDVDGDGEYETILKWDPTNSKDSSQDGFTGNTYLDCYKLDGKRLWRIDEGQNSRAGAHYTQFIVYDLDGDGKAEVALRTAPGTIDGQGNPVLLTGDRVTDNYRNATTGRVNGGPEYFTIFAGQTGAALATTAYKPDRIATSSRGDDYGNRQDRYLMAVAYLDGQRPSLVLGRGIFGPQSSGHAVRNEITAWNWRNDQLSMLWWFRADRNAGAFGLPDHNTAYVGQGNYEMQPADVDGDGRDEIVYGSMTIDDNGQPLYSTGLGYGDALHVSDMDPAHPGLEIYMPMENPESNGHVTANVHDGATGAVLWNTVTRAADDDPDVGRGNAFDIDPNYPGYETWGTYNPGIYNISTGVQIQTKPSNMFVNFGVWWDADPLRELEDGTTISDWKITNGVGGRSNFDLDPGASGTQQFAPNAASNNGAKSTPALVADLFGDWREEVVWRRSGNTALEIFTTIIPATSRLYTLMHDTQYREAIAWQNVGYNQLPHPSFFLGAGMAPPTTPNIYLPQASPSLIGDFNGDGAVDGEDLAVWGQTYGQTLDHGTLPGDADGDDRVDGADFLVWQRNQSPIGAANALTMSDKNSPFLFDAARHTASDEVFRHGLIEVVFRGTWGNPLLAARRKDVENSRGTSMAPIQNGLHLFFEETTKSHLEKYRVEKVPPRAESPTFSQQKPALVESMRPMERN